jgi:hypothetical protein
LVARPVQGAYFQSLLGLVQAPQFLRSLHFKAYLS